MSAGVLPDHEIRFRSDPDRTFTPLVTPFTEANLQPASYDLTLADDFKWFDLGRWQTLPSIDLDAIEATTTSLYQEITDPYSYYLPSLSFVLARTVEKVKIPINMVARVEGKSSLGRLGLSIHTTAGYIDPGFEGTITLEMFNQNRFPIILRPGKRICQISFQYLSSRADKPYGHPDLGSKYQDQNKTTTSRYAG